MTVIIVGRQSGKTWIASMVGDYEALQEVLHLLKAVELLPVIGGTTTNGDVPHPDA